MAEPRQARPTASATSLNPAAGHHAVTADPRELAAAERAGDRSWATWRYYARRYGDRGRQFTRSDSAWLATLPGSPTAAVQRQIRWLGSVLASRGMPRLLLEDHLRLLHHELVTAVPERAAEYGSLLDAADTLRDERLAYMPEAVVEACERGFHELLESSVEDDLRAGALLAAAVADEQAGLSEAVTSLLDWLADPERFPGRWRLAVDQTLRLARDKATGPAPTDAHS
jgi:hypothetical protein